MRPILLTGLLTGFGVAAMAAGSLETTSDGLVLRVVAEVQTRQTDHGQLYAHMSPADKVAPGDFVFYTLQVRNAGGASLQSPVVIQPVPAHMAYVANSATGPGCEVAFSVDGGQHFDRPENLKVSLPDGAQRPALARDYTHLRFQMASLVKADSVLFLRFRARVK